MGRPDADDLDLEALLEAPYKPAAGARHSEGSLPDDPPRDRNGRDNEANERDDRHHDRDAPSRGGEPDQHRRRSRSPRPSSRHHVSGDDRRKRSRSREGDDRDPYMHRDRARDRRDGPSSAAHDSSRRPRSSELTAEERDRRTVFVMQLSQRLREDELFRFFEKAGKVRDARLIGDRNSRRSKGIAYVEFFDVESAANAVALTGKKLLGIPVIVQFSEAEKNRQIDAEAAQQTHAHGTRVFVGALHFSLTESDIRQIFEPFGPIELINLLKDDIGRSRGTAHIQFANAPDARKAMERMNGFNIAGRIIKVGMLSHTIKMIPNQTTLDDDNTAGYGISSQARADLMAKLARDPAVSEAVKTGYGSSSALSTTQNCMLTNMFDPDEETAPHWDQEIRADVEAECKKYGAILHCFVDKPTRGHVYLKFATREGCQNAIQALNGRWFAGKQIAAKYVDDAEFFKATGF